MAQITNQDIISKLATLEANFSNLASDFKDMKEDVGQIKRDTRFLPIIKGIVFTMVVIVLLGAAGVINSLIFHQPQQTQASNLPATSVQVPGK